MIPAKLGVRGEGGVFFEERACHSSCTMVRELRAERREEIDGVETGDAREPELAPST